MPLNIYIDRSLRNGWMHCRTTVVHFFCAVLLGVGFRLRHISRAKI